jgi:hypothetical protein
MTMDRKLESYEAMWTTEKDSWLLERSRSGSLLPMRRGRPPHALVIEDDELAAEVCRRMQAAGVEVVGVIGREIASASAAEAQLRQVHPADSPLRQVKYDSDRGEVSLHTFVASATDDTLRMFVGNLALLSSEGLSAVRAALTMDDFYTLLTFARRSALASVREGRVQIATDGVTALTAIDAERIDWRDMAVASALLAFALRRAGAATDQIFVRAAERAEVKAAEILQRFAHESVDSLKAWGFRLVDTPSGQALFDEWGHPYEPSVDLGRIAGAVAEIVDGDSYQVTGLRVGSNLPMVWVRGADPVAIKAATESMRGCAIVNASLRPGVHPKARDQHFLAFIGEAASSKDAALIASSAKSQSGVEEFGVSHEKVWCVAVGRSVVKGVASYERAGSLERFKPAIAALLVRL